MFLTVAYIHYISFSRLDGLSNSRLWWPAVTALDLSLKSALKRWTEVGVRGNTMEVISVRSAPLLWDKWKDNGDWLSQSWWELCIIYMTRHSVTIVPSYNAATVALPIFISSKTSLCRLVLLGNWKQGIWAEQILLPPGLFVVFRFPLIRFFISHE